MPTCIAIPHHERHNAETGVWVCGGMFVVRRGTGLLALAEYKAFGAGRYTWIVKPNNNKYHKYNIYNI